MKTILICILGTLFFLSLIFLPGRLIKVGSVVCRSQFGQCEDYLLSKVVKAKGKSVLDGKGYLNNVLGKEVKLRSYGIRFKLPASLLVDVIARRPVVATTKDGSEYRLLDQEAVGLGTQNQTRLPVVVLNESLDQDKLERMVQIMAFLHANYQNLLARVNGDSLEVDEINGKKVIFSLSESDPYVSLGALKLILSRLITDSEMNRIRIIDLRFKNPVLK